MGFKWIGLGCGLLVFAAASCAQAQNAPTCCLCGKKVCVLEVSKETEDVVGFKVEPKEICIPGIRLPWDPCGTRRCGGVRTVCVLSEVTSEKTVCKYDWSIKTICTSCCKRHGLKHGLHHAQLQKDERIPFEYYTAQLAEGEADASVSAAPQSTLATQAPVVGQLPTELQQANTLEAASTNASQPGVIRQVSGTVKRWFDPTP